MNTKFSTYQEAKEFLDKQPKSFFKTQEYIQMYPGIKKLYNAYRLPILRARREFKKNQPMGIAGLFWLGK